MERGPSVEDLIHSVRQDVFNHMDSHSPMFGIANHNQFQQNGSWNAVTDDASSIINQSNKEVIHQNVSFPHGRPQTPYKPVSNDIMIVTTPMTASTLLQSSPPPQTAPNYTTTFHEELTFNQPQSTDFQDRGTLYSHKKRSAEVVQLQPHSLKDHGNFMPQPPLEPRRSRTRSSIRRAAKLLLNRSKQVLSSSDSNISCSTATPPSRAKASKRDGGSSVKERLNRNRARMGQLLKSPSWKERSQSSSEEKENSYMIHPEDVITISTAPGDHVRLSHANGNRRFHSAENISSSILSSDSSHYSGSEFNDAPSNYMDDVSFDGSIVGGGYALRRYNSGPIEQRSRQRKLDHHRGYHTADSDTDSSISKGENRNMAVQNRFGSGRHVRSTRDALKKLNRNRSFNGHSSKPVVAPKQIPSGPLKGDHTIQPFIHNERLPDSYILERWKEQGARPKYSSSESLETESVNHEIFPDTAIRSDSEDHRGSRSSLASKHSRPPSPSRSVRFEDQELDTNGDICKATNMVESERTSKKDGDTLELRYKNRPPEGGGSLRCDGRKMTYEDDEDEDDVFINGNNDISLRDSTLRHRENQREQTGNPSRTHGCIHGNQGNHGNDAGRKSSDLVGYSKNNRQDMSGLDATSFGRGSSIGDEDSIWDEDKRCGGRDARTHKPKSPVMKSNSKDDDGFYSKDVLERNEQTFRDHHDQLEDPIEPVYDEVKRAKKRYSTQASHYYDAIQAHSAWDEYKRKLMEENQRQRASSFAGMSSLAKNRDHVQKLSGSNLSIASNSSLSEKMQNLGHATKQSFGRMRRALSLDKISRNAQKDDPFDKESRLKRSPSLRSLSSFLGKKKDKLMGSFTDLSTKERRSASISGPSSSVVEQVTNPSYMRKIGRVLEVFDDGTQLVRLVKPPSGPFGFYIAKGSSANGPGIFVKRIGDGHPAKILAGLLQVGDEILEINGQRVKEEKNLDLVYDLILDSDNLVLKIRPLERRNEEFS